jgi:hypothetical protein
MSFNKLIHVGGGLATGRYIGGGRDTSGPTGAVPVHGTLGISLQCISSLASFCTGLIE